MPIFFGVWAVVGCTFVFLLTYEGSNGRPSHVPWRTLVALELVFVACVWLLLGR